MFMGAEWRIGALGTALPSSTLWKACAVENSSVLGNPSLTCPHVVGPLRLLSIQAQAETDVTELFQAMLSVSLGRRKDQTMKGKGRTTEDKIRILQQVWQAHDQPCHVAANLFCEVANP